MWAQLMTRIQTNLFRFKLSPQERDDVLQTVLVQVWKNQMVYEAHPSPQGWLTLVIRNTVFALFRKLKAQLKKANESLNEVFWPLAAHNQITLDAVWNWEMPAVRKRVAQLYYGSELSVETISLELNLNQSTVLSHLKRFRDLVRSRRAELQ